jgi:glycogen(starch) synthase
MRILLYSPAFLPSIGGIEINQAFLADQLTGLGHEVTVVTQTAARGEDAFSFSILRRPGPVAFLRALASCDVLFQANVSLRGLWPLLFVRRPWAVSHHSWYTRIDGHVAWQDRLKRFLLRFAAVSISVSQALADDLGTPSLVIPNAYRDKLFRCMSDVSRTRDLIFVGRLVSDKGLDLLIAALARLDNAGMRPVLTVVGDGPELSRLRIQARELGVSDQIEFAGLREGDEVVRLLNQHRILVVPSRYHEPFGIVALEGIACGCAVVGSAGGGLPEAMGPCGRTFPNGQVEELASVLADLLTRPQEIAALRIGATEHLAQHTSARIARLISNALEQGLATHNARMGRATEKRTL